jgi:hypothetical protein
MHPLNNRIIKTYRQSIPRSFVRKLATFCLPLFDIQPVARISRIFASTNGTPVLPAIKKKETVKFV